MREKQTFHNPSTSRWQRTIYNACAKLYFCSYFYSSRQGGGTNHTLLGEDHNIFTANEMAKHFINIGNVLAAPYAGSGRSYIDSFKKGYASRMYRRMEDRRNEAMTQTVTNTTGTALVLIDVYKKNDAAIALYKQQENIKLGRGVGYSANNASGYAAGQAAANGVSLNRSVSGGQRKAIGA